MQPPFCAEFGEWAIPKLVALISSQSLRGQPDVAEAMADFERQPFAQPAFLGNLGEDGAVYVTADALRKRAEHFFKIVTCTAGQALLAAEDDKADDPLVEMTAVALWASTEQPRLRALTHLRLGMSPTVGDSQLPSDFHEQRRVVTQHEFDRLSETERAQWHELARACQQALSRRETVPLALHDRRAAIQRWMEESVKDTLSKDALVGRMVIQWNGYYIGREDRALKRFDGQMSTYGHARWIESRAHITSAAEAWRDFVSEEVNDFVIFTLRELPQDAATNYTSAFRGLLKFFLEELFRVQCQLEEIDRPALWACVKAAPHKFVAPDRLPGRIPFADPQSMAEGDFRAVYDHIWLCHVDRDAVKPESRFVYEPDIISEYVKVEPATQHKAVLDKKKRIAATLAIAAEPVASPIVLVAGCMTNKANHVTGGNGNPTPRSTDHLTGNDDTAPHDYVLSHEVRSPRASRPRPEPAGPTGVLQPQTHNKRKTQTAYESARDGRKVARTLINGNATAHRRADGNSSDV